MMGMRPVPGDREPAAYRRGKTAGRYGAQDRDAELLHHLTASRKVFPTRRSHKKKVQEGGGDHWWGVLLPCRNRRWIQPGPGVF